MECDYSYLWSKQLINCRIVRDLFGFRIYSESGSISLLLGRGYNVKKPTIQRHAFQLMPTLPRTTGALFKGNLSFNFVTTLADSVGSISVLFLSSSSSLELYAVNASILVGRVATWSRWGAKFNGAWLSPCRVHDIIVSVPRVTQETRNEQPLINTASYFLPLTRKEDTRQSNGSSSAAQGPRRSFS